MIHATDQKPWGDQKTVATICYKRCSVNRALSTEAAAHPEIRPSITCVGCRAILEERDRQEARVRQ